MRLRDVELHNTAVQAGHILYQNIIKKLSPQLALTGDNYLVYIHMDNTITRFATIIRTFPCARIVGKVVDGKVCLPDMDDRYKWKKQGLLDETYLENLSLEEHEALSREWDTSALPMGEKRRIQETLNFLLDAVENK
jgi:hypothetical protein